MSTQFEPFQSDAFREARARMQQLTTPSASSTSGTPCTPRASTATPSPPATESSPSSSTHASSIHTPLTEASDSSAGSSSESSRAAPRRPTHAAKRVLSEGDVLAPLHAKRNCRTVPETLRKRSVGLISSGSDSISNPFDRDSRLSSVNAWRRARQQRQRGQRAAHPSTTETDSPAPTVKERSDVLPELRLLSATRTAPIGWSQLPNPATLLPKLVEPYDEKDAGRAPERQRFWPIVDKQLDYTGARMLSLSTASSYHPLCLPPHRPGSDSLSPKSSRVHLPATSSASSDSSPLTPDTPVRAVDASSRPDASPYATHRTRTEADRVAKLPISAKATLGAMIDFTRAQHAQRNPYGQLIHSPPSPPSHAPLRIAPKPNPRKTGRDYFGHWEVYLCNYGKESRY